VYKATLVEFMRGLGHEVRDFGTNGEDSVDYPDFIRPVAEAVARGEYDRGVVLGGSGNGEAMVANKVRGVRCALCWDTTTARLGREHNDANVVSMGQRVIGIETAKDIVQVFLTAEFQAGRHVRRLEKMES
jgi:ribose 5-phosphate isomerase B